MHRHGSIPRPSRSRSTAPGSRSTTPRRKLERVTVAAHRQHRHRGAGDRRRARRRAMRGWRCATPNSTLERRSITAPIAGIVGILPVEAGNYVTTETAIATIDDRSQHHRRFLGAGALSPSMVAVGVPLTATPIARPERGARGHGQRRRQPHRRAEPHPARAGAASPTTTTRCAPACRSRWRCSFPGDTYPVGRSAGHPVGHRRRLRLGRPRRQGRAHAGAASSSATPKTCWSRPSIAAGDKVVTEGVHAVRDGADVLIADAAEPAPASAGRRRQRLVEPRHDGSAA